MSARIGDVQRFPTVKDFLSYCRLVKGTVPSAGKIKGLRGAKPGKLCPDQLTDHASWRHERPGLC